MRGSELTEAMTVIVDLMVNARKGMRTLDRAIEAIFGMIDRFNGKDVTSYLEAYKAEMLMRDVPKNRRLSVFHRVVTPSIHAKVLKVQADCRNWQDFEGQLLKRYGLDDLLRLSKRELMEWVELPRKGRNTSVLL